MRRGVKPSKAPKCALFSISFDALLDTPLLINLSYYYALSVARTQTNLLSIIGIQCIRAYLLPICSRLTCNDLVLQ